MLWRARCWGHLVEGPAAAHLESLSAMGGTKWGQPHGGAQGHLYEVPKCCGGHRCGAQRVQGSPSGAPECYGRHDGGGLWEGPQQLKWSA